MSKKKQKEPNKIKRVESRIIDVGETLNNGNVRSHVFAFLEKYFLCETISKLIMVEYKKQIGTPIEYKKIKMDLRILKPALNYFHYDVPEDLTKRLFYHDKINNLYSAKGIRNNIVHELTKTNLIYIENHYSQLISDLDRYINIISK